MEKTVTNLSDTTLGSCVVDQAGLCCQLRSGAIPCQRGLQTGSSSASD